MDAQTRLEIQNLTEQQQQYVIQTLPVKEKSRGALFLFEQTVQKHLFVGAVLYLHRLCLVAH